MDGNVPGTATVTAAFGGVQAQRTVTVTPVLTGITVTPASASLTPGQGTALSCIGTFSDGSTQAVGATWSNGNPSVTSMNPSSGTPSSVTVTAVAAGISVIAASVGTMQSSSTVKVIGLPGDPMPVFAHDDGGVLKQYPPMGGGAPTTVYSGTGGSGLMMDATATKIYFNVDGSGTTLKAYSLSTGAVTTVGVIPTEDSNVYIGLDDDSQGRVYTQGFGGGLLWRIDPATGSVTQVGNTGGGRGDLAIGSDNQPRYMNLVQNAGGDWLFRHNLATNTVSSYALVPSGAASINGMIVLSGVAASKTGPVYATVTSENRIFRHVDLNGDGDALDAGEQTVFATLPITPGGSCMIYGVVVAGGGSVLVSVETGTGSGIYWLRDLNGDGDAADANEVVLYNTTPAGNTGDAGGLAAPK